MGVGTPPDLLTPSWLVSDMFDCVLPTHLRLARHRLQRPPAARLRITRAANASADVPLDVECTCSTKPHISRSTSTTSSVAAEPLGPRSARCTTCTTTTRSRASALPAIEAGDGRGLMRAASSKPSIGINLATKRLGAAFGRRVGAGGPAGVELDHVGAEATNCEVVMTRGGARAMLDRATGEVMHPVVGPLIEGERHVPQTKSFAGAPSRGGSDSGALHSSTWIIARRDNAALGLPAAAWASAARPLVDRELRAIIEVPSSWRVTLLTARASWASTDRAGRGAVNPANRLLSIGAASRGASSWATCRNRWSWESLEAADIALLGSVLAAREPSAVDHRCVSFSAREVPAWRQRAYLQRAKRCAAPCC